MVDAEDPKTMDRSNLTPSRPENASSRSEYVAASPRVKNILDRCDAKALDPEVESARAKLKADRLRIKKAEQEEQNRLKKL